jgi:hypothetical protein
MIITIVIAYLIVSTVIGIYYFRKALQHTTEEGAKDKVWLYFWSFMMTSSEREKYFEAEGMFYLYKLRMFTFISWITFAIVLFAVMLNK